MSSDYGTYRLTYTPPAPDRYTDYPSIAIDMSTDGSANVDQMLQFFEAFLAAAGYILKGELEIVEPGSSDAEFWKEQTYMLLDDK